MAKRGRPKKSETMYKGNNYGFIDYPKAMTLDSTVTRAPKQKYDFKFKNTDDLSRSIYRYLQWGSMCCPFGILMKNVSCFDYDTVERLAYSSRTNDADRKSLSNYIAEIFTTIILDHRKKYGNKLENIAFKFTVNFDMRRYANNLSVIYHIINDIHYNLFKDHIACYILNYSPMSNVPLATLTIYVSNASTATQFTLSHLMANNFDYFKSSIASIIGQNLKYFSNSEGVVSVKPLFINETPKTVYSKPAYFKKYYEWYTNIYKSEINNSVDVIARI